MNKYDIGILTFWNVPNYGTFAQAYALQKTLQAVAQQGDVRQIAHLDIHHYNFYYDLKAYYRDYKPWSRTFWRSFFMANGENNCNSDKQTTFFAAYDTIPHTVNIDKKNVGKVRFNKIFLGSDIVWDYTIEPFNNDKMLFGETFNTREVNSYAASFGTVKNDTPMPTYVEEGIKGMRHVSVRDENSADLVEKITGKRPPVVLDPVWLWDFNHDDNIQLPEDENYILVYGQDFTEGFIQNLIAFAKSREMKIVALDCNADNYTWCDKLIKQQDLSPYLWIGYFKKASIVATSTFHGITFGMLFKKKIAFCKTDFIIAKIGAFLKEVGLYELFDNPNDVEKMLTYQWDYKQVDEVIERQRSVSLEFIKKACEQNI